MSDFTVYTALEIVEWLSQGTIDAAPSNIYVGLHDDTEAEVSTDFLNDRVETTAGTDWDVNQTSFENANVIDFGEALNDVSNITFVSLNDAATGGNQLAFYELSGAPFSISSGSTASFPAGELEFDVIDRSQ